MNAFAQQWCASTSSHADLEQKEIPARAKTEITIPVIVHVIWSEAEENISVNQINAQIAILNQDFRALNTDLSDVYVYYSDKFADMEINFELATIDPVGNSHSGIIRENVPPSFWSTTFENGRRKICYEELGGSSAWCTSCYLNIWVVKEISNSAFAGLGIFPTQIGNDVPREEDGVYIRYNRFGRSLPNQLGRTTTHEIGHYLNLFHPWGANDPDDDCNATICCGDDLYDDYVSDTEYQIVTYLNECPSGLQQSCGQPDNYQNFMGYATDECLLMFTQGQKARVWDALMTYRSGLLNSNCIADCVVSTDQPIPINEWLGATWINSNQLQMDVKTSGINWKLYDMQGRQIHHWKNIEHGWQSVLLPKMSAGVYLLKGEKNGQLVTKKVFTIQ